MNLKNSKSPFLCRRIAARSIFFVPKEHRISSALFKDSQGISVDIDGQRKKQDIMYSFVKRFKKEGEKTAGLAYINNMDLHQLNGIKLEKTPVITDRYHYLITDGQRKTLELNSKKARKLVKLGHVVKNKSNNYMDENNINYEEIW